MTAFNIVTTETPQHDKVVHLDMPKKFCPPSIEEVLLHCAKIGLPESQGERFMAYWESCGWIMGKTKKPMVSWRGAMQTWKFNWQDSGGDKSIRHSPRVKSAFELKTQIEAIETLMKPLCRHRSESPTGGYVWDNQSKLNEYKTLKTKKEALMKELVSL